jgi:hypothetical protein
MAKTIMMDEVHVTVLAPHGLTRHVYESMHRALCKPAFAHELRRTIRNFIRRFPELAKARIKVSR